MTGTRAPLEERFWRYVAPDPNSGCWLWMGAASVGYGVLHDQDKGSNGLILAHRVSYLLHKGPIPPGLEIDHRCRMRCCVNPDHLEAVTHKENCARGIAVQRVREYNRAITHCPAGHEYSAENTYLAVRRNGGTSRHCRACAKARGPAQNKRKREARARKRQGYHGFM